MALHIIPAGDTTDHVPAYSCPCGPRRDTVDHEGSLRWAVVHDGLDPEGPRMSAPSGMIDQT